MYVMYHVKDGTSFDFLEKAFDYEWNTTFSQVEIYDFDGNAVSSLFYNDCINFIYKVHDWSEFVFVKDYLRLKYDEVQFHEMWQNENKDSYNGYIIETESEIAFITKAALQDFFGDNLDPKSNLAYELKEGD